MSRKIIIAGAGHGGLIAGALLAEKGYDVTVYERNIRDDLGYDWDFPRMLAPGAGRKRMQTRSEHEVL